VIGGLALEGNTDMFIRTLFLIATLLLFSEFSYALTLKVAALSPDGSTWMRELRKGAEEIKTQTQGRVKFKFYPGGVMGDDKTVLRKMRVKQLHGAAFSNGSLNKHFPDIQIYNLVMKFRSLEEVDYVRQKMDQTIIKGLEDNGLVSFGISEIGFAYLMSQKPIRSINELRARKVWIPEGNTVAAEAVSAFSVTPIPLPLRDVLVALQTSMVDTVAGSPIGALTLQWHTQVNYLTQLPLSYIYGVLALDKKMFSKISLDDQKIVRTVLSRVSEKLDKLAREDNIKAMEAIKKQGIKIVTPTEEASRELAELIAPANHRLTKSGKLSEVSVQHLEKHLNDYRNKVVETNATQ